MELASAENPTDVQITVHDDGLYELSGSFQSNAPLQTIWSVLTDYERIDHFVSFVQSSSIKDKTDGTIILEQESKGQFWFFSKTVHVLLKIQEDPLKSIKFEDLSQNDFHVYKGSWTLEPDKNSRVVVRYKLKAIKNFFAPSFIARTVFRENVRSYLLELREEIFIRSQKEYYVAE